MAGGMAVCFARTIEYHTNASCATTAVEATRDPDVRESDEIPTGAAGSDQKKTERT